MDGEGVECGPSRTIKSRMNAAASPAERGEEVRSLKGGAHEQEQTRRSLRPVRLAHKAPRDPAPLFGISQDDFLDHYQYVVFTINYAN